ncbi:hypothetical protein C0995_007309, partial [Termitomyces sp. Mi166
CSTPGTGIQCYLNMLCPNWELPSGTISASTPEIKRWSLFSMSCDGRISSGHPSSLKFSRPSSSQSGSIFST